MRWASLLGLLALFSSVLLAGCEKLSTAAAMRVEVEVYKGPLSKDPETQMGELVGLMNEAADALRTLQDGIASFRDDGAPEDNLVARFHWKNIEEDLVDLIDGTRNLRIATNAWLRRFYPSFRGYGVPQGQPSMQVLRTASQSPDSILQASAAGSQTSAEPPRKALPEWRDRDIETKSVEELETICEKYINSLWPEDYYLCRLRVFDLRYQLGDAKAILQDYGTCEPESLKGSQIGTIQKSINKARQVVWAFREAQRIERANALVKTREYEVARAKFWRKPECLFGECTKEERLAHERATARARAATIGYDWAAGRLEKLEEELQCAGMSPAPAEFNEVTLREIRTSLRAILMHSSQLAERYRAKALLWAEAHVGVPPSTEKARWAPATFSALASQYADKMTSKADSLLKQVKGDDRRELPLSIALRESSPPDFLKLYVWNYAATSLDAESLDWTRGLQDKQDQVRDRVKVIERLFTDGSWTKVNTVYAGGQGTVRMALIKDDVGNWNLKSFDNDPTKLLEAYKNLGYAALSTATQAIAAASSGGSSEAVSAALQVANKVALGSGAAAGGGANANKNMMTELRGDLVSQIRTLDQSANNRIASLGRMIEQDGKSTGEMEQALQDLQTEVTKLHTLRNRADELDRQAAAAVAAADAISEVANRAPADTLEALRTQAQQKRDDARKLQLDANMARLASTNLEAASTKRDQLSAALDTLKAKLAGLKAERDGIAKATLDKARQALDQYRSTLDSLEAALVNRVENKALDKLQDFVPNTLPVSIPQSVVKAP